MKHDVQQKAQRLNSGSDVWLIADGEQTTHHVYAPVIKDDLS